MAGGRFKLPNVPVSPTPPVQIPNGQMVDPTTYQNEGRVAGEATNGFLNTIKPSLDALYGLLGMNGGASAAGSAGGSIAAPAPITSGGGGGAPVSAGPVSYPSTTASDAASLGQAKDQAAQLTSGSLAGLRDALDARGMGGAGFEGGQTARTLIQGTNLEGEASRNIITHNTDLAHQQASEAYQGGIAQRGQDISAADAQRQSQVQQRGQDIEAETANAQLQEQKATLAATSSLEMLRTALGLVPKFSTSVGSSSAGVY